MIEDLVTKEQRFEQIRAMIDRVARCKHENLLIVESEYTRGYIDGLCGSFVLSVEEWKQFRKELNEAKAREE